MKLLSIKASKNADSETISSLIGRAYVAYYYESSVLVYSSKNKTSLENTSDWDSVIMESVDSDDCIDYLNLYPSDKSKAVKKKFLEASKKLFKTYDFVIINSNELFEDLRNGQLLLIFTPTKIEIAEIKKLKTYENTFLILNQNEKKPISEEIRDLIHEIDLKLIAKFEDKSVDTMDPSVFTYDESSANLEKVLRGLELV